MRHFVRREIETTIAVLQLFAEDPLLVDAVAQMGTTCGNRLAAGNKIMLAGNGGSAADSQHIAAEFVSRLAVDRHPLPAVALTTDSSILTAVGNDYGFEQVFERQLRALGNPGDVFIGISTSGNSRNVLRALAAARHMGVITMGLTGEGGGGFAPLCDHLVRVPSTRTQNIQETHILIGHTICGIAEQAFLPAALSAVAASRSA